MLQCDLKVVPVFLCAFLAGATVYVHGKTARPVVSNCVISDSENVGIFVTDGAQVGWTHFTLKKYL